MTTRRRKKILNTELVEVLNNAFVFEDAQVGSRYLHLLIHPTAEGLFRNVKLPGKLPLPEVVLIQIVPYFEDNVCIGHGLMIPCVLTGVKGVFTYLVIIYRFFLHAF